MPLKFKLTFVWTCNLLKVNMKPSPECQPFPACVTQTHTPNHETTNICAHISKISSICNGSRAHKCHTYTAAHRYVCSRKVFVHIHILEGHTMQGSNTYVHTIFKGIKHTYTHSSKSFRMHANIYMNSYIYICRYKYKNLDINQY